MAGSCVYHGSSKRRSNVTNQTLFFFFDDRMCSHAVVIIVGRRKLHLGFENPTVTGWSAKLIAQTICFLVQDKLVLGSYHGDLFSCPQHNRGL